MHILIANRVLSLQLIVMIVDKSQLLFPYFVYVPNK